ncbi:Lrp/AsnC family transcriptional regulator [Lacibacterium aquatile]|uniref:Lrp/AsnC family transcriptional regulator n=1 Tax=Lacibacterium aquatile TaxID=1168082 RepID=A0ABW5DWY2_9PROT
MEKPPLDGFDRKILLLLQEDGRMSMTDLAEKVGLSATPCQRRVKRLEEAGLITGYRAQISRTAAGRALTAFVYLKVDNHGEATSNAVQQAMAAMPEVVACYITSGEADFMVELVLPDLAAYEAILFGKFLKMPMIKDVNTTFVLRTVKQDGAIPV